MVKSNNKIILASSSPRRAQLLESLGISFEVVQANVPERPYQDEASADYIIRMSRAKAVEVAKKLESGLVIGSDTEVVVDGKLLGKPQDERDARRMLKMLSGRWHAVMTGV